MSFLGRREYPDLTRGRGPLSLVAGAVAGVILFAIAGLVSGLISVLSKLMSLTPEQNTGVLIDGSLLGAILQFGLSLVSVAFFLFLVLSVFILVVGGPFLLFFERLKIRGWLTAAITGAVLPTVFWTLLGMRPFGADFNVLVLFAVWGCGVGLAVWFQAYERPYRRIKKGMSS